MNFYTEEGFRYIIRILIKGDKNQTYVSMHRSLLESLPILSAGMFYGLLMSLRYMGCKSFARPISRNCSSERFP